jgi:hypothetical protein
MVAWVDSQNQVVVQINGKNVILGDVGSFVKMNDVGNWVLPKGVNIPTDRAMKTDTDLMPNLQAQFAGNPDRLTGTIQPGAKGIFDFGDKNKLTVSAQQNLIETPEFKGTPASGVAISTKQVYASTYDGDPNVKLVSSLDQGMYLAYTTTGDLGGGRYGFTTNSYRPNVVAGLSSVGELTVGLAFSSKAGTGQKLGVDIPAVSDPTESVHFDVDLKLGIESKEIIPGKVGVYFETVVKSENMVQITTTRLEVAVKEGEDVVKSAKGAIKEMLGQEIKIEQLIGLEPLSGLGGVLNQEWEKLILAE